MLYTGLRPFRFPSLLCLTPAPRSVGEHDGVGHRRGSSLLREEDQYPPPADIQNHLLGKAGNPSAYIHTGSYGCTFCKKHRQFSNRCQPARCAECFFSYTAAAMHQQIKRFVSSFFIFFASCASILWFSCKNRSGHFRALASCFSPRSASDAARYS